MSSAFCPNYHIPVLTHTPSTVLVCATRQDQTRVGLCPLDERSPGQNTGMFVTASGWSSRAQWSWTRTKLRITPHLLWYQLPNAKRPTSSSVARDTKRCPRDVASARKGAAPASLRSFIHLSIVVSNVVHKCCGQRRVTRVSLQRKGRWAPTNWFCWLKCVLQLHGGLFWCLHRASAVVSGLARLCHLSGHLGGLWAPWPFLVGFSWRSD